MRGSRTSSLRRKGFTLVELLVVIGIISVLISLLLPALNRARNAANSVKCSANLRQIGQLIAIYAVNNKGSLPYGYWNGSTTGNPNDYSNGINGGDWTTLLGNLIDSKNGPTYAETASYSFDRPGARGVFLCPSAQASTADGLITHYSAHPRLMASLSQADYDPQDTGPTQNCWFKPYRVAQIQRSSDIALVFDGSQESASGGVAGQWGADVTARQLDQGRIFYDGWLVYQSPEAPESYMVGTNPVDTSSDTGPWNTDDDGNWHNIRFRHGKNNQSNILFVDGHVSTYTVKDNHNGDLLRMNVEVNYEPNFYRF